MRVAVIGGGASGMVVAYLLGRKHQLTVFEKQPVLGGNIRTINKNVRGPAIDEAIKIDNGVIEFEETNFVYFHRLMRALDVPLAPVPGTTGLFLADGRMYLSPYVIQTQFPRRFVRAGQYMRSIPVALQWLRMHVRAGRLTQEALYERSVGQLIGYAEAEKWARMLMMYSYSIPYAQIDRMPATLGASIIRDYWRTARWNRIVGGVYTYIEKILERFTGRVVLNADIVSVERSASGVRLRFADGATQAFDKVVFATPPDQVLALLADPTDAERRRFGAWRKNVARTVIHTDLSIYRAYGASYYSEFDVFEKQDGRDAGYNAYLNRLAGLPDGHPVAYNLAYNLEDRIDAEQILHRQEHHTPLYTQEAMFHTREIAAANGENHTYHAGAYLGDGLHEGAVTAALAVSGLLGGRML